MNGIIHLPFLELSFIIFRDIKMSLKVGQPKAQTQCTYPKALTSNIDNKVKTVHLFIAYLYFVSISVRPQFCNGIGAKIICLIGIIIIVIYHIYIALFMQVYAQFSPNLILIHIHKINLQDKGYIILFLFSALESSFFHIQ